MGGKKKAETTQENSKPRLVLDTSVVFSALGIGGTLVRSALRVDKGAWRVCSVLNDPAG